MGESKDWQQRAGKLFCICVYAVGAYLALKYLLVQIAPILLAFCISAAVHYAADRLSARTKIPRGVCAVAILTLVFASLGFCIFYACRQLLFEIRALLNSSYAGGFGIFEAFLDKLESIGLSSSFASFTEEYASHKLASVVSRLLSQLAGAVSNMLSRVVKATPSAIVSGVLTIISCYYMSVDFERVSAFLIGILPKSVKERLKTAKCGAISVALGYLKGYSILFLITFFEALVGLLLLCPSYAWLWALVIAAVDVLPILGAGTVLIPWGVISIINGQYFVGIGLIVLYIIITVVRQIAEPYVLGKGLGLHPLASLMSMFIGFRLLGVVGMMLAPIFLAVLLKLNRKKL